MSLRHVPPIRLLTALLAVALMAVPSAGAVDVTGDLAGQAERLQHRGALGLDGSLSMMRLFDAQAAQSPLLHLDAESAYGFHIEQDFAVAAGQSLALTPPQVVHLGSEEDPLEQVRLWSVGSGTLYDIRIVPTGDASFTGQLRGTTGLTSWPEVMMDSRNGMEQVDPSGRRTDSNTDEQQAMFVRKVVSEPVLVSEVLGSMSDVRVTGDFILEFIGISAFLDSERQPERLLETGRTEQSTAEGHVTATNQRLLRLLVQDGDLRVTQESSPIQLIQFASTGLRMSGDDGRLALYEFRNILGGVTAERQVRFPDGYRGDLAPGGDHVALDLARSDDGSIAPTASMWLAPTGFNPLPIAAALVAVALVTLTVRTLRTPPPLAHMESALEAGAFSRAARLAGRILRTDPKRESAHLGRAIALSRSGRPERVVRDLKPFLDGNEPSDGTLHYVLGLAYQDLGKEKAAAQALSEAVRRTPALAQQMAEAPEAPQRGGPEGDAQGYT